LIGLSQILKENGQDLEEAEKVEFIDAIYETSKPILCFKTFLNGRCHKQTRDTV
jgi:hypothetical protein